MKIGLGFFFPLSLLALKEHNVVEQKMVIRLALSQPA